ncbi:hypothetical protein PPERSA_03418 [Pseudocohnilembus persalinus]|uniref:Uncharacterized protein n=1 Tax=Pseudocohnilembus persalinus TaxID=266149 RepID=A0A0V0QBS8_PSEPJ|nr:hypothetical protein PPERSA_03418 [Pseudocohnilembus persalinus]|eukprot:KRW99617.1 hypothetical protein PPERSA_03418 [Pseudocohnilembus persalinus]
MNELIEFKHLDNSEPYNEQEDKLYNTKKTNKADQKFQNKNVQILQQFNQNEEKYYSDKSNNNDNLIQQDQIIQYDLQIEQVQNIQQTIKDIKLQDQNSYKTKEQSIKQFQYKQSKIETKFQQTDQKNDIIYEIPKNNNENHCGYELEIQIPISNLYDNSQNLYSQSSSVNSLNENGFICHDREYNCKDDNNNIRNNKGQDICINKMNNFGSGSNNNSNQLNNKEIIHNLKQDSQQNRLKNIKLNNISELFIKLINKIDSKLIKDAVTQQNYSQLSIEEEIELTKLLFALEIQKQYFFPQINKETYKRYIEILNKSAEIPEMLTLKRFKHTLNKNTLYQQEKLLYQYQNNLSYREIGNKKHEQQNEKIHSKYFSIPYLHTNIKDIDENKLKGQKEQIEQYLQVHNKNSQKLKNNLEKIDMEIKQIQKQRQKQQNLYDYEDLDTKRKSKRIVELEQQQELKQQQQKSQSVNQNKVYQEIQKFWQEYKQFTNIKNNDKVILGFDDLKNKVYEIFSRLNLYPRVNDDFLVFWSKVFAFDYFYIFQLIVMEPQAFLAMNNAWGNFVPCYGVEGFGCKNKSMIYRAHINQNQQPQTYDRKKYSSPNKYVYKGVLEQQYDEIPKVSFKLDQQSDQKENESTHERLFKQQIHNQKTNLNSYQLPLAVRKNQENQKQQHQQQQIDKNQDIQSQKFFQGTDIFSFGIEEIPNNEKELIILLWKILEGEERNGVTFGIISFEQHEKQIIKSIFHLFYVNRLSHEQLGAYKPGFQTKQKEIEVFTKEQQSYQSIETDIMAKNFSKSPSFTYQEQNTAKKHQERIQKGLQDSKILEKQLSLRVYDPLKDMKLQRRTKSSTNLLSLNKKMFANQNIKKTNNQVSSFKINSNEQSQFMTQRKKNKSLYVASNKKDITQDNLNLSSQDKQKTEYNQKNQNSIYQTHKKQQFNSAYLNPLNSALQSEAKTLTQLNNQQNSENLGSPQQIQLFNSPRSYIMGGLYQYSPYGISTEIQGDNIFTNFGNNVLNYQLSKQNNDQSYINFQQQQSSQNQDSGQQDTQNQMKKNQDQNFKNYNLLQYNEQKNLNNDNNQIKQQKQQSQNLINISSQDKQKEQVQQYQEQQNENQNNNEKEETGLFYIEINTSNGKKEKIYLNNGDNSDTIAKRFAQKEGIQNLFN